MIVWTLLVFRIYRGFSGNHAIYVQMRLEYRLFVCSGDRRSCLKTEHEIMDYGHASVGIGLTLLKAC